MQVVFDGATFSSDDPLAMMGYWTVTVAAHALIEGDTQTFAVTLSGAGVTLFRALETEAREVDDYYVYTPACLDAYYACANYTSDCSSTNQSVSATMLECVARACRARALSSSRPPPPSPGGGHKRRYRRPPPPARRHRPCPAQTGTATKDAAVALPRPPLVS